MLRILITRPKALSRQFVQKIEALGYTSVICPTFEIETLHLGDEYKRAITKSVLEANKMVLTSPTAVAHLRLFLRSSLLTMPTGTLMFGVGQSTRDAICTQGYAAVCTPSVVNSETLVEDKTFRVERGETVAIIGGVGGRTLIQQYVSDCHATAIKVDFYRRKPVTVPELDLKALEIDVLTAMNGLAIEQIWSWIEKSSLIHWRDKPLIVFGQRLAEIAAGLGFSRVIVSDASMDAMINEIKRITLSTY